MRACASCDPTLGAEIVVRHRRSYGRGDVVYDPLHYPSLLEKKPGALDQAAPLRGWKLDPAFGTLRRLLEARFGPRGIRHPAPLAALHLSAVDRSRCSEPRPRATRAGGMTRRRASTPGSQRLHRQSPVLAHPFGGGAPFLVAGDPVPDLLFPLTDRVRPDAGGA